MEAADRETGERTEVVLPGVVAPEGLHLRTSPVPAPAAWQVVICMEATGVCFADLQMRRGRYYDQPKFPFVPGYDLVGTIVATGTGADPALLGQRVAALTKVGGWASHVLVAAADVVPVPPGLDPAQAETVVLNGITAWQMLHRKAHVKSGDTIVVHGASGGVGTILVQLAQLAGARVIGTASPRNHDMLRDLGVIPVDYHADITAAVREIAPGGVDAVFDHLGIASVPASWRLLAPGGTLVAYGNAANLNDTGSKQLPMLKVVARLWAWNALPNRRHAYFYVVWPGSDPAREQLRQDLAQVLQAMADGHITAQIAARYPLAQAADAVRLAESRTIAGKVILTP
jgi:NADPH:quinone reductase-like Zn-dependent oxidoreductase